MQGPENGPPVRRAGDSADPRGGPGLREWQRNTWYGPAPVRNNPFDEPEDAPELRELRSDNVNDRAGAFWQDSPTAGYMSPGAAERERKNQTAARRSQRRRRDRTKKSPSQRSMALTAALALIGVTFVTFAVLYFFVFRIREIRVEGNRDIATADVIRLSGLRYGDSMMTVSEDETQERLISAAVTEGKRNPNFYRLQFRYLDLQMPGTVVISVKEREPCCWMELRGILFVMDKNRMVLYESEDPAMRPANLVEVRGLGIRAGDHAGQTLTLVSALQESVFENLFLEMKVMGITGLIEEVDLSNLNSILLQTRAGFTVSLGSRDRIHAKLRSMILVQEELIRMGKEPGTINVTNPESPFYSPAVR